MQTMQWSNQTVPDILLVEVLMNTQSPISPRIIEQRWGIVEALSGWFAGVGLAQDGNQPGSQPEDVYDLMDTGAADGGSGSRLQCPGDRRTTGGRPDPLHLLTHPPA